MLGVPGGVIETLTVVTGIYCALVAAVRSPGLAGVPPMLLAFLAVPFFDVAMFGTLVALSIAKRDTPETHKRLMLHTSIVLVVEAIARWPLARSFPFSAYLAITTLFLVPLVLWDLTSRGRVHPARKDPRRRGTGPGAP